MGIPDSRGVPADTAKNTLQVPYNDLEALEKVLKSFPGQIACLIMEPVLGNIGPVLPEKGYLAGRAAAHRGARCSSHLRRGHNRLPAIPGRSAGALWRKARSDHFRQDHRRRISHGHLWRPPRSDGAGGAQRRHLPGRNLQRQSRSPWLPAWPPWTSWKRRMFWRS